MKDINFFFDILSYSCHHEEEIKFVNKFTAMPAEGDKARMAKNKWAD